MIHPMIILSHSLYQQKQTGTFMQMHSFVHRSVNRGLLKECRGNVGLLEMGKQLEAHKY